MGFRTLLGLKQKFAEQRAGIVNRPPLAKVIKDWQDEFAKAQPREILTVGITLASASSVSDWAHTSRLFSATLNSVLRQSDPRLRVIVCGHEFPDIKEIQDPRVALLELQASAPTDPSKFRSDKSRKRFNIGRHLRGVGGGFFMQLDADDLIHRDLAKVLFDRRPKNGFVLSKGYASDWSARTVAPVPGVWTLGLDRICGSTFVVSYTPEDLPERDTQLTAPILFNMTTQHNVLQLAFEEEGRALDILDLDAVIYTVNHNQNLSFALQRKAKRGDHIVQRIREEAISDPQRLAQIDANFGTSFAAAARP